MQPIQFVKGSDVTFEGMAIPFGDPQHLDLDGEFFDRETDLCLEWFPERPVLYDHGTNAKTAADVIGRQTVADVRDDGVWITGELEKRSKYRQLIVPLIDEGALSFSSGAMSHLVRTDRKSGHIERWPWVELSMTPTPANPEAVFYRVKALDALAHIATISGTTSDGTERSPFEVEGQRVLADLATFVDRAQEKAQARAKAGRVLSATNRQMLAAFMDQLDSLEGLRVDIRSLLADTDPEKDKRAAEATFAAFLELEANLIAVG